MIINKINFLLRWTDPSVILVLKPAPLDVCAWTGGLARTRMRRQGRGHLFMAIFDLASGEKKPNATHATELSISTIGSSADAL